MSEGLLSLLHVESVPARKHVYLAEVGEDGVDGEGVEECLLVEPEPLEGVYLLFLHDGVIAVHDAHEVCHVVIFEREVEVLGVVVEDHLCHLVLSVDEVSHVPAVLACEHGGEDVGDVEVELVPSACHVAGAGLYGVLVELVEYLVLGEVACLVLVVGIVAHKLAEEGRIAVDVEVHLRG